MYICYGKTPYSEGEWVYFLIREDWDYTFDWDWSNWLIPGTFPL
jgi:hypothetical protein